MKIIFITTAWNNKIKYNLILITLCNVIKFGIVFFNIAGVHFIENKISEPHNNIS